MLIPSFYQFNLFIHLVAVSLWLGLTVNFSLLMVPLIRELPEEVAESHMASIGRRARKAVGGLMIILLVTGLINLHRLKLLNFSENWGTAYGMTVGLKISLALILFLAFPFLFVLVHRYGSENLEDRITRMNYLHWTISIITLFIMYLGVLI